MLVAQRQRLGALRVAARHHHGDAGVLHGLRHAEPSEATVAPQHHHGTHGHSLMRGRAGLLGRAGPARLRAGPHVPTIRAMGEPRLRTIFDAARVAARVEEIGEQIARDLVGSRPVIVAIAEGARRFAAALATSVGAHGLRSDALEVRARRTRSGTRLGPVRVDAFDSGSLAGRDVLVVDDIADEGRTLAAVCARVRAAGPRSLRIAVLVAKHERRQVDLALDYVGFDVDEGWVVGFGMDLDGAYRDLDEIALLDGSP